MSSSIQEEIELLERVLLRLGCADTDEKLEACVGRFLTPVILKISSPHEQVRNKVVEVLTHVKRRITSRPQIQIPVEALIDQYKANDTSLFLQNFAIIFIALGYTRLSLEQRTALSAKLINCEPKLETYQDKLLMLILPDLGDLKLPTDPAERKNFFRLDTNPNLKQHFLMLLQDVLLLPYGVIPEQEVPPGLSPYSFKRIMVNNWKAEDLEKIKKGIVRFICSGVFTDKDIFILLVLASTDTRFSVASPALAELSKVCTMIEFTDPQTTEPLYTLFSGNNAAITDRKTTPCGVRVRQKLLIYLIKCRGRGIHAAKGIQVVFEGLFGINTNQKCKVLSLQFAEHLIKGGPHEIIIKVAKVLLNGFLKLVGKDSKEPIDVQNAAYAALAQLARTCPQVINKDLKIVLSCFDHLTNSSPDLHSSIREALVAMAPAFTWKSSRTAANQESDYTNDNLQLSGQQLLMIAMLSDNADSKLLIVQNVTSVFITTCYPEYYAPARYLLLLIAGERNSLYENVMSYLYGVSKKDHINYNALCSIDNMHELLKSNEKDDKLSTRVLPSFKKMMHYINEMAEKGLNKSCIVFGKTKLSFSQSLIEEILSYLRLCLWYSAGANCAPGTMKYIHKLKKYIQSNYEESENNEVCQYVKLIQQSVEAKRSEINLLCLYDVLSASCELLAKRNIHLLEPLNNSLKDVSEITRIRVAQVIGLLWAYSLNDEEFDNNIKACLLTLQQSSLEHKHGCLLVLGHALSKRIQHLNEQGIKRDVSTWLQFMEAMKIIVKSLNEAQWLLILAAINCITMMGKYLQIPNIDIPIAKSTNQMLDDKDGDDHITDVSHTSNAAPTTKLIIFNVLLKLLRSTNVRLRIREEAAKCLGNLAIGDGEYFTHLNLEKFLTLVKVQKEITLNIAIADAIVLTLCGYDVNEEPPSENYVNPNCDDKKFEDFLNSLIHLVTDTNPHARQACSVWMLAVVKHCSYRSAIFNKKQLLQYAFTELLSDDSEFVQDVASRGLTLVYNISDSAGQNDLANALLDQLIGGKRKVKKVNEDTELFADGMLGKTPTGGNMTTYKELCGLASDLNQPEMIYQFMRLANHNATWTSKLGAAFGLQSLSSESKAKLEPYLGKIVPRLYRYKYDPTPKIQNSMISIWDSLVGDSKDILEKYYWEILEEITKNLTFNEWRVRIACCLALRDLLKRPNGLRLRCEEVKKENEKLHNKTVVVHNDSDINTNVPEPELKELWLQLFRVMDDIHEGTRLAAQGTATCLSKLCVTAASSGGGKIGTAIATSILPLLLETGVVHVVTDIRKISIKTVSDMIDSSGTILVPHLPILVPCLLRAAGELDSRKLSYLSTQLSADNEAQEAVDTLRAEAVKSHHITEATNKCIRFINYSALEEMTPAILDLIKTTVNLGTKVACAHFTCLISIRLGTEMTPLVSKYLGACFIALKDRNATVQKYYASAIGHLFGLAKEQSIRNLFIKLDELYMDSIHQRSVVLVIQSMNKRHNELLKDYSNNVIPLMFFAMHEELNDENKENIDLWRDLWHEVVPGNAAIRSNLSEIILKLEHCLSHISWVRKTQAANAIQTIAVRLSDTLEEKHRLHLIEMLLKALHGRTFRGKKRVLQALAALCKNLNSQHEICERIVEAVMKESRKDEPEYRTDALIHLGDILEILEVDRFEEVYTMLWPLVNQKSLQDDDEDYTHHVEKELSINERNQRLNILNKLKETIFETLGKAWPKRSLNTQFKYQQQFAQQCCQCLKEQTRPVQLSLLIALAKFVERLQIWDDEILNSPEPGNKEKKVKIDEQLERDTIRKNICQHILTTVTYVAGISHTGLKKEALHIILLLLKRLCKSESKTFLYMIQRNFEENSANFQKDSAPEIRRRIKDIEELLNVYKLEEKGE